MPTVRHFLPWVCLALFVACDSPAPTPTASTPSASASGSAGHSAQRGPNQHRAAAASAGRPPRQPPIDGAPLYQRYCALCHGKDASGYAADNAPSLVSRTFLESAGNGFIARAIRLGRPGTPMAAYGKPRGGPLDEQEIQAIVRFLRSKGPAVKALKYRRVSGDPEVGARLYEKHCVKCHGTDKKSGTAPMLHNPEFLRVATPTFLRYAIVNGRPPTKMEAFAKTLSEANIDDLVAFLRSKLPGPQRSRPDVDLEALKKLPVVMNPQGKAPSFTLRDELYVSMDQVKKAWDTKKRFVIIDARAASDFVVAHIPGAISNPYYEKAGLDRVPKDGTWVVAYCACPHHASGAVVDELRQRGYPHTAVLDEGILAWQRSGYPIEGSSVGRAAKPGSSATSSK